MNAPGEQLQISNDGSHSLGNGLLWRISEAAATWKGDLLSTTRREAPMPFRAPVAVAPVAGAQMAVLAAEARVVLVVRV